MAVGAVVQSTITIADGTDMAISVGHSCVIACEQDQYTRCQYNRLDDCCSIKSASTVPLNLRLS
jgi:hypothetical protein